MAAALIIDAPLKIVEAVTGWVRESRSLQVLMTEQATFKYSSGNLVPRVLLSHFLSFARDKLEAPEFFCWPGAWMAGSRAAEKAAVLFDRHGALFIDTADNDGIFPRRYPNRADVDVQTNFDTFYASNLIYHMTHQWIMEQGAFTYDYQWLSQTNTVAELKGFADRHFEMIYGVHPDSVRLL